MRTPKVLAAPDSFKGTASASAVAGAIANGARRAGWECDLCPMSDGGEGFAEVLGMLGGEVCSTVVTGPLGESVEARWRSVADLAVVECAEASGLVLAGGAAGNDPIGATSRGTGELIATAIAGGARRVLVGLGGSAMTDGGLGAVEAIEESGGLRGVELVVACDVDIRFTQTAPMFGPQKGATAEQVITLQSRLEDLAVRYQERYGVDVEALVGSGAAGGLAGGLAAVGGVLRPGFDLVADAVALTSRMADVQVVVTGEGRVDATTWTGKVVAGVMARATSVGVPVLLVAGTIDPGGAAPAAGQLRTVDLSERFGVARAIADAERCVTEAIAEILGSTWE
jgi:glycerate kinase